MSSDAVPSPALGRDSWRVKPSADSEDGVVRGDQAGPEGVRRPRPVVRRPSEPSRRPIRARSASRGAPGGERNGASVSTSSRSVGTRRTTSALASSPGRKTSPLKLTASPRARTASRVVQRSRIRVDDRRPAGPPKASQSMPARRELRRGGRPGRRARRPSSGSGRSPACRSPRARARLRRRFASWASIGRDIRSKSSPVSPMATTRASAGQLDDPGPAGIVDVGRVVRMDADGRVEPRGTARRGRAPAPTRRRPSRARGSARPRPTGRAPITRSTSPRESVGLEVAVAVDETHRRDRARRAT